MTAKDSSTQVEPEPVQETTQADEHDTEHKADEPASLPVVQSLDAEADEPKPDETEEETNRKQDEAISSLAEQTDWIEKQTGLMEKQTVWIRRQAIWTSVLAGFTLVILILHGWIMSRQSQDMKAQTEIMKGQLESMQSDSAQTQQMIEAMRKQADASQSIAEGNKDLVGVAGKQADAASAAARAADKSSRTATQALEIENRAYLVVTEATFNGRAIHWSYRNTGQTVATDISADVRLELNEHPSNPLSTPRKEAHYNFGVAAPSSIDVKVITLPKPSIVEEEAIKNGALRIVLRGEMKYRDFGGVRTTKFCWYSHPKERWFSQCRVGNSVQ
jgi:hypothetical protein